MDFFSGQHVLELKSLERGNHKLATSKPEITEKQLLKDVHHGFSFPIPSGMVRKLKGVLVQPCGLASQLALKVDGSREEKHWLTHDLSYKIIRKGISVNNWVNMSPYPKMILDGVYLKSPTLPLCGSSQDSLPELPNTDGKVQLL
jgi:hypothetical protein